MFAKVHFFLELANKMEDDVWLSYRRVYEFHTIRLPLAPDSWQNQKE